MMDRRSLLKSLLLVGFTGGFAGCNSPNSETTPPQFTVGEITITYPAEVGKTLTIGASIHNEGDEGATQLIELHINDTVYDDQRVSIAAGESKLVEFEYLTHEAGRMSVTIASEDDTTHVDVIVKSRFD